MRRRSGFIYFINKRSDLLAAKISAFSASVLSAGGVVDPVFQEELRSQNSLIKSEAKAILVPGAYKEGSIYGLDPATGDLVPFTFSRPGVATYFDKNGILQTAAANVPRIDYDPVTKVCRGYMQEAAATNLILRSNSFSTSPWVVSGFVSNPSLATTAPDGSIVTGFDFNNGFIYQDFICVDAAPYCSSIWVKTDRPAVLGFRKLGVSSMTGSGVDVDLSVNTTTQWQRINVSGLSSGTTQRFLLDNRTARGYGLTTDLKIWIWEAQTEPGLLPSSNIKTTGSQVTRPADTLQSVNDIVPYAEASVFMNMAPLIKEGTTSVFLATKANGKFIPTLWHRSGGSGNLINMQGTGITSVNGGVNGAVNKVVASYTPISQRISGNGVVVSHATASGAAFNNGAIIKFWTDDPLYVKNHIKSLAIFNRQLTDAEHIMLTQ